MWQDYEMNSKNKVGHFIQGQGHVKFHLALIGLKIGENKPGCDGSIKWIIRMKLVNVIQGQDQVKFHASRSNTPIFSNLVTDNKPGCDGFMKWTLRMRLVNLIQGQGQVKYHFAEMGSNLVRIGPKAWNDGSVKRH